MQYIDSFIRYEFIQECVLINAQIKGQLKISDETSEIRQRKMSNFTQLLLSLIFLNDQMMYIVHDTLILHAKAVMR